MKNMCAIDDEFDSNFFIIFLKLALNKLAQKDQMGYILKPIITVWGLPRELNETPCAFS